MKCKECGIDIEVKYNRKTYCSSKCRAIGVGNLFVGDQSHFWRGGKIKKICPRCNQKFEVYPSLERIKYCSKECQHPKAYKTCGICGKEFKIYPSQKSRRRFCSKRCHIAHQRTLTREKSNQWKGGVTPILYPYAFKKIKETIRKRDNYTCQGCNKSQEQELAELNKKLCVHHIDHDVNNNDFSNLITLCTSCNVIANRENEFDYWISFYQQKLVTI